MHWLPLGGPRTNSKMPQMVKFSDEEIYSQQNCCEIIVVGSDIYIR